MSENITFKYNIGDRILDDNRDLIITGREIVPINRKIKNKDKIIDYKYYYYKCNKCGYLDGYKLEYSFNNGVGCPICSNKNVCIGINDIPTTAPWMIKYFQGGYDEAKLYTYGSGKSVYFVCPDCGLIKDKKMKIVTLYNTHSISCRCSDKISYPEKFIKSVLSQLKLLFVYQLSKSNYSWCNLYRYDFYLHKYNAILEVHGDQHYRNCKFKVKYNKQKEIDKSKKIIALENGITTYVEIDCRYSNLEFIKNSLENSELNKMVDLSNVDWNLCDIVATKNLVKEVCEYYMQNKNILPFQLGEQFGISSSTARVYLAKGKSLNWCDYDPNIMHKVGSIYSGKNNTKPVNVFKDGQFIKSYSSIMELANKSIEDFGIAMTTFGIGSCVNGHRNTHKGYQIEKAGG